MKSITLTAEECRALFGLIEELSGQNPESVFAGDGTDDPSDPLTRAAMKLYRAAGESHMIPDGLKDQPTD